MNQFRINLYIPSNIPWNDFCIFQLKSVSMKCLSVVIIALALVSCSKRDSLEPEGLPGLTGSWVNIEYQDSIILLHRSESLNENAYGFRFQSDGTFIERKNAGWCGTPPIVYSDFDGHWSNTESNLHITVAYWGGTAFYEWKVLDISKQEIKIRVISQDYIQEGSN